MRDTIVLDDTALRQELLRMTDAFTDRIALGAAAAARQRPWTFVNELSRLVIDPERFIDGTETMDRKGMGAVYTRTSHGEVLREGSAEHHNALLEDYFPAYSDAFVHLVQSVLDSVSQVVLIDVHSFPRVGLPYEDARDIPRPPICLGTDSFHTPAWLVSAAQAAFAPLGRSELNTPFSGTYVPLRHYQKDPRVSSLMVEIRRDLYMDESTGERDSNGIATAVTCLASLINVVVEQDPAR